jgi:hypothetical protein
MESTRNQARWAGLLYGVASSLAPFSYLYVPGRLLVPGDAAATAERVRASEGLLRAAIYGELYGVTVLLFAALAFHELFARVDARTTRILVAMMLVSVPISYVNALNHVAPLILLGNPAIAAPLDPGAIGALVTFFLRLHNFGLVVNQIFWGLWLIPLGLLVRKSGWFPRWLAWPLFAAGIGYVLHSLGTLFLPPAQRGLTNSLQMLGVGEMPFFAFYVLIWGVRGGPVDRAVPILVLVLFALGVTGLLALMTGRIDAIQYAGLQLVKLVLAIALVWRWRREEPSVAS